MRIVTFEAKIWYITYTSQFDGFLTKRVQNVCEEVLLIFLNHLCAGVVLVLIFPQSPI